MPGKRKSFEKEVEYNFEDFKKSQRTIENPQADLNQSKPIKDVEQWSEQSNSYLKHHKIPKRVIDLENHEEVYNSVWHNFLIIVFILTIITALVILSWGVITDKFGTTFVDNSTMICNVDIPDIPVCPECPSTSCDIDIPECPVCPDFPEEINIVLSDGFEVNESG